MKKIIKQWGDSLVITINPEEQEIYELKKGDKIDVEISKTD